MKKVLALLCALTVVLMAFPLSLGATDYSFLEDMDVSELMDLRDEIDDRIADLSPTDEDENEDQPEDFATRKNPVKAGESVVYSKESYSGDSVSRLEILHVLRGDAASALLKSFNRYNTRSLAKDEEWIAIMINIEVLEAEEAKVEFNSYYFNFVSENGVEYDTDYISDNPAEVSSLYAGAQQNAWIGCRIKSGDRPLLNYDDFEGTLWFDPNVRAVVDTSSLDVEPMDSKSKGDEVTDLQYRLMEYGLLKTVPSGKYDKDTVNAVRKLQKAFGLENTDGQGDVETLRVIYSGEPLPEAE